MTLLMIRRGWDIEEFARNFNFCRHIVSKVWYTWCRFIRLKYCEINVRGRLFMKTENIPKPTPKLWRSKLVRNAIGAIGMYS